MCYYFFTAINTFFRAGVIEVKKLNRMNDNQLIKSCLQGEAEEFRKIVEKYRGKILAMAMNILRNKEDAEDACQEAFIQAYRNLGKFDIQKSFPNWLFTILYNRCRDQLRKKHRFFKFYKKVKSEPDQFPSGQILNQSRHNPFSRSLLEELSPKERTAIFLWASHGYTSEEIASVMKCSSSTARVHLFKARKKIKSVLEKKNV